MGNEISIKGIFCAKNKTAAQWTSENPILRDGELGCEKDTRKSKVGDGVTKWNDLPYEIVETAKLNSPAEISNYSVSDILDAASDLAIGEMRVWNSFNDGTILPGEPVRCPLGGTIQRVYQQEEGNKEAVVITAFGVDATTGKQYAFIRTVGNGVDSGWSSFGGGSGGTEFPEINYDQLGTPLSGAKLASVIASGAVLLTGDFGTGENSTIIAPKLAIQVTTESCFMGFISMDNVVLGLKYVVNNTTGQQSTEFISFVCNGDTALNLIGSRVSNFITPGDVYKAMSNGTIRAIYAENATNAPSGSSGKLYGYIQAQNNGGNTTKFWYFLYGNEENIANPKKMWLGYTDGTSIQWSPLHTDSPIPGYTKIGGEWTGTLVDASISSQIHFTCEIPKTAKLLIEATIQSNPTPTATIYATIPLAFAAVNGTGQGVLFEYSAGSLCTVPGAVGGVKLSSTSAITGTSGVQGLNVTIGTYNLSSAVQGAMLYIKGIYAKL